MIRESSLARIFIEIARCLVFHTEAMGKKGSSMYEAARTLRGGVGGPTQLLMQTPCQRHRTLGAQRTNTFLSRGMAMED